MKKTTKKVSSPVNLGDTHSRRRRSSSDDGTSTGSVGSNGGSEQAAVTDPLLPRQRGSGESMSPRPPPASGENGGEELLRGGSWVLRVGSGAGAHPPKSHPCCWSYGRDDDPSWSLESASFLHVTHRPAHRAHPRHTNSALYRRSNPTASARDLRHQGGGRGRPCGECRGCRCGDVCSSRCCRGPTPYFSATSDSSGDSVVREVYGLCDVVSIRHLDDDDLGDVDDGLMEKDVWPSGPGAAGILASGGDVAVRWGGVRVRLRRHGGPAGRRRGRGGGDDDDFAADSSGDALDETTSSTASASVVPPAPPATAEIELSPPLVRPSAERTTAVSATPSGPGVTSRHPLLLPKTDETAGGRPTPSATTANVVGRDDDDHDCDHEEEEEDGVTVTFALPRLCRVAHRDGPPGSAMDGGEGDFVEEEEEDATDLLLSAACGCAPPPLVWRVSYPRDPALSIDSLTVFDGDIRASSHSADVVVDDDPGGPTHVYVNGWQSWSFAGAVPRGDPQPCSAMPDFLSRAFNFGGSLPPRPSSVVLGGGVVCGGPDGGRGGGLLGGKNAIKRTASGASSWRHRLFDAYPGEDVAHRAATAASTSTSTANTTDVGNDPEWTYKSDLFACVTRNVTPDEDGGEADMLDSGISSSCTVGWLSQRKQFGLVVLDDSLTRCSMYCSCDGVVSGASAQHPEGGGGGFGGGGGGRDGPTRHPAAGNEKRGSSSAVVRTDWAWCQIQCRDIDDGAGPDDEAPSSPRAPLRPDDNDDDDTAVPPASSAHHVDHEPMADYLEAVGHYNDASQRAEVYRSPLSVGWCSWYHYYEHIDAATLVDNFSRMSKFHNRVGFNCSVVDDGYMTAWGDWDSFKPNKFDLGMRALADEMRGRGMRPGLWMAPYAADKHSRLAREHPDWLIRNHAGRVANSSNCGKFFYGLDGSNPEVREYAARIVRRAVRDWGYEVLKLDFLYAACLEGNGKFDLGMTRAETMYLSLRTLRDAAGPDVFLIGCGCPLGSAVGMVDGMRISADTGPTWNPSFPLPWWDNSTLPCLRAMVRNSLTRAGMGHRWWHNDPDCLLLGESTDLTEEEVVSASTVIAMTGGMLLLSDDLTALSAERFDVATKIYPITGATAIPLDLHCSFEALPSLMRLWCTDDGDAQQSSPVVDGGGDVAEGKQGSSVPAPPFPRNCIHVVPGLGSWSIVSMSNWLDTDAVVSAPLSSLLLPRRRPLRNTTGKDCHSDTSTSTSTPTTTTTCNNGYHVFAFWSSKYVWIPPLGDGGPAAARTRTLSKRLCPHETEIFHLREVSTRDNNLPQYIGSDLHFTCGYEVQSFVHATDRSAIVTLKHHASCRPGSIFMYLPCQNVLDVAVTVNGDPARVELVSTVPCGRSLDTPNARAAGCVVRIRIRPNSGKAHHADGGEEAKVVVKF